MKIIEITSRDNQMLKLIRGLASKGNKKEGEQIFLVEGSKLIQEALDKNVELNHVVASKSYFENELEKGELAHQLNMITVVPDNIFKGLYSTDTSCGIVAVAAANHYILDDLIVEILANSKRILLLGDNIQDPGNLGTIIRTGYAFNAGGIILSEGSVDCYNPKVVRSSMGAIFSFPVMTKMDLKSVIEKLKKNNFHIIALDNKAHKSFRQEKKDIPLAYILGNEGHGISLDISELVDSIVCIPISADCESLNVAVAAGIILAEGK